MDRIIQVGINTYPSSPLSGCVNDVEDWREVFSRYDLGRDISSVTDNDATTENIRDLLGWAKSGPAAGDLVIFQYSGHGSQVPDLNDEEADKLDEIICPVDLDWDTKMITDDELNDWATSFPPDVKVIVILDSCHSGTGTRNPHMLGGRSVRFLPPPEEVQARGRGRKNLHGFCRGSVHKVDMKHLLMAGCKSTQYSYDAWFDGRANGAFSYFATYLLKRQPKRRPIKNIHRRAVRRLRRNGYDQKPQLEGPAEWLKQPLFQRLGA